MSARTAQSLWTFVTVLRLPVCAQYAQAVLIWPKPYHIDINISLANNQ